ncbi:hypothetical protein [uncultured Draconibacterium sp.]|uniref:hypothetical protein n=1 Tax=uncultured Draconibacterium sp. TaxID=1573823 RepID=UPI003216CB8A
MNTNQKILMIVLLVLYVVFNFYVQIKLIKTNKVTNKVKVVQTIVIWIFPFLGAWTVNWTLNYKKPNAIKERKKKNWNTYESGIAENF